MDSQTVIFPGVPLLTANTCMNSKRETPRFLIVSSAKKAIVQIARYLSMKGNHAKNINRILRMIRCINNLKEETGLSNAFSAIYLYRESKIKTS